MSAATHLVAVPVADLRAEPKDADPPPAGKAPYAMDPLQETQLIYNEEVIVHEEKDGWARVEAVEQPEFTHSQRWEGYPGWTRTGSLVPRPAEIPFNAVVSVRYMRIYDIPIRDKTYMEVPLGSRMQIITEDKPWARVRRPGRSDGWAFLGEMRRTSKMPKDDKRLRRAILKTAGLFLGEPYYWGGRSGHRPHADRAPSGVDCSALVHLAYRANGVDVPRDSHEQFMKAKPLAYADMKPGDLIFLAKTDKPDKIVHVMIFTGGDGAVEAVHEFNAVRRVTVQKKLGKKLKDIGPGETPGDRVVRLGRLLPE